MKPRDEGDFLRKEAIKAIIKGIVELIIEFLKGS